MAASRHMVLHMHGGNRVLKQLQQLLAGRNFQLSAQCRAGRAGSVSIDAELTVDSWHMDAACALC